MNEAAAIGLQATYFHRSRTVAVMVTLVILIFASAAAAAPVEMTVGRLIDLCSVSTLKDAAVKGDGLGWLRMRDADMSEWHSAFVGYNGGSVEVVGWKHEQANGADSLSFWIAVGLNSHQACAYSTKRPAGLVDALKARLGPPDDFNEVSDIQSTTAFWNKDGWEYAYSQIGSSAMIEISRDR